MSKLLRRILENTTDDEVIGIAQSLGLGQNSAQNPNNGIQMPKMETAEDTPPVFNHPSQTLSEPDSSKLLRPRVVENPVAVPSNPEQIRQQIAENDAAPVKRENSLFRRLGNGIWKGIKIWSENGGQGGILGLAGATLTGGIGSAVSPNFEGELNRNDQKQRLLRQLGETQKQQDWQTQHDTEVERIANMRRDDEIKREEMDTRREERKRQFDENLRKTTQAETDRKRANFYRQNKYFDPAKATEAQKRQLAEFGESPETIGAYDFTKPDRKTVAGVTYQYNPNTKSFEETDLPKDKSKEIVEYEITDPATGVTSKYAVSTEKAAGLKTSLIAAGMQINAANARQDKQLEFSREQLDQRRKEFILNYQMKISQDAKNNMFKKADELRKLEEAKNSGKIDSETYAEMKAVLDRQ